MNNKTPAKTLKDRIFNFIITALAVFFVILIAGFFSKVKAYSGSVYTAGSYSILSDLNRGSYQNAVNSTWRNRAVGVTDKKDASYEVPFALSDYYLAAFYETAYRKAGNTAKADELAAKKASYREKTGDLEMIADEMDTLLAQYGK